MVWWCVVVVCGVFPWCPPSGGRSACLRVRPWRLHAHSIPAVACPVPSVVVRSAFLLRSGCSLLCCCAGYLRLRGGALHAQSTPHCIPRADNLLGAPYIRLAACSAGAGLLAGCLRVRGGALHAQPTPPCSHPQQSKQPARNFATRSTVLVFSHVSCGSHKKRDDKCAPVFAPLLSRLFRKAQDRCRTSTNKKVAAGRDKIRALTRPNN